MMCFRDMTFCANSDECANDQCARHWNNDLQHQADAWWGGEGAPVAMGFYKTVCGKFMEKNN